MIILSQTLHSIEFCVRPTRWKLCKWVVANDIFTHVWDTYFLSCTWYSQSAHFCLLGRFLYLTWSITPFLRDESERCFWNSVAILISVLTVEVWIAIFVSYATAPGSCKVIINMDRKKSVALKQSITSLPCREQFLVLHPIVPKLYQENFMHLVYS